jgi:hypothetical protein
MPLPFLRFLSVLTLAGLMASITHPAEAQRQQTRGRLASRHLPLRLTLARYGIGNTSSYRNVRLARLPANDAPRRTVYSAPVYSAPAYSAPVIRRAPAARPIALGAYFYQNGQSAPGDMGAVNAWKARAGRMPAVWMIYQSWSGWNQFPASQAQRARQLGGQLMVTWEPWDGRNGSSNWSCATVANGSQDGYIRRYARAVRSSGVPVMIRFAHEMNGDWYPWATAFRAGNYRHNGNTPGNFVAMWRHVVNVFRQEGATNVSWVWSPNIHYLNGSNSLRDQNADLAALYPGDNYVNWIGLSVYADGTRRNWRAFTDLFDGAYRTVTRLSSKPLMIAEMSVTEGGAPYGHSKASWISQTMMNDIPTRYPRVRLVNWFCRDKTDVGEGNYRFDTSSSSLQAFRVAANSPIYSGRLGR